MTEGSTHPHHLTDIHQSWWQLAAIQLTGVVSLPIISVSVIILQSSNFTSAMLTLFISNIVLWLIRWSIISMSFKGRKNVLDLCREYMGKTGSIIVAILLLVSTLAWFVVQTTLASNALTSLVNIEKGLGINRFIQTGVLIGVISTLFCMNGMVVLKWLSIVSFPILTFAFICVVLCSPHEILKSQHSGISLAGLPLMLAASLGETADLPTFFRHSRSLKDSFQALTTIQIISFFIGLGGLFLASIIVPWFGVNESSKVISDGSMMKISLIVLIFLSSICTNVSNVYSASVGWELVAPIFAGIKEYMIMGLGLTIIFILVANIFTLDFLADATGFAMVNLCLVFSLTYVIYHITKKVPDSYMQIALFFSWLVATIINVLQFMYPAFQGVSPIWSSIIIILSAFFALTGLKGIIKRFI